MSKKTLWNYTTRTAQAAFVGGSVAFLAACGATESPASSSSSQAVSSTSVSSVRSSSVSSSVSTSVRSSVASSSRSSVSSTGTATRTHYANPFSGAKKWYVNDWWSKNAKADGGDKIANYNTGVWMDRNAAIGPIDGKEPNEGFGLREHLDAVLDQGADLFHFVVYNLPGRDCSAKSSNGELAVGEMDKYKHDYIDRIYDVLADDKYAGIRIVAVIEIDSLPNLVTNADLAPCKAVMWDSADGGYVEGVRYALTKLSSLKNVHNYVDAAHSGWLGWEDKFQSGTSFLAAVVATNKYQKYKSNKETDYKSVTDGAAIQITTTTKAPGWGAINGFISNTANYTPLEENFKADAKTSTAQSDGTDKLISATFFDWNPVIDEKSYGTKWIEAMKKEGAPSTIGMLVDTGRNGWGGPNRPAKAPTSISGTATAAVDKYRFDRRPHRGSWCNQEGGVGERPQALTGTFHAYVWTKPQGESDGVSNKNFEQDPNDPNKQWDEMCDPEGENHYAEEAETTAGKGVKTGAMGGAPHAGRWFSAGFKKLVENAYPKL